MSLTRHVVDVEAIVFLLLLVLLFLLLKRSLRNLKLGPFDFCLSSVCCCCFSSSSSSSFSFCCFTLFDACFKFCIDFVVVSGGQSIK